MSKFREYDKIELPKLKITIYNLNTWKRKVGKIFSFYQKIKKKLNRVNSKMNYLISYFKKSN